MGILKIECGNAQYLVEDVDAADRQDSGNWPRLSLDSPRGNPSSAVRIVAKTADRSDQTEVQLIILTHRAPSEVNEHSATCFSNSLFLATGSYVVRLLPSLQGIAWTKQCDAAACFGIYGLDDRSAVLVHGETTITLLSVEGEILWQVWGRDVFVESPTIDSDFVKVRDITGVTYEIEIQSGLIHES